MLNVAELSIRTGLVGLVHTPTRGASILDMLMISEPDTYFVKVVPPVRTDRKAILATTTIGMRDKAKRSATRAFRRRFPNQHANMLHDLANYDTWHLASIENPQQAWDAYYREMYGLLDKYYPVRTVTMTNREPAFVTPQIKFLLRRKNKLMRKNRVEEAGALANRIGSLIDRAMLRDLGPGSSSKELWSRVNEISKSSNAHTPPSGITADVLNNHYATISTDPAYTEPPKRLTANKPMQLVTEQSVFTILDRLHCTAEGLDMIPAWLLRLLAPVYASPLAHIINNSITEAHVPDQWKVALINPIPKTNNPTSAGDYRPLWHCPSYRYYPGSLRESWSAHTCTGNSTSHPSPRNFLISLLSGLQAPLLLQLLASCIT